MLYKQQKYRPDQRDTATMCRSIAEDIVTDFIDANVMDVIQVMKVPQLQQPRRRGSHNHTASPR